jgi:hypothetical protein
MPARRSAVAELAAAAKCSILCLQETKLSTIDSSLAMEIAGPSRKSFIFLPASDTRGGAAVFWDDSVVALTTVSILSYSITASVKILETGTIFLLTNVYGPSTTDDKPAFLQEMVSIKPVVGTPWLIMGDFNLIYEARDKNNLNLSRRLMGQFRAAIDATELIELRCSNRRFSWSNERVDPTLVYLDRMFYNAAWDAIFSPCTVQALSSSHSDHCPLLITSISTPPRKARFRFENFWPRHAGFFDVVRKAWAPGMTSTNPLTRIRVKLGRTARALRSWSKELFGDARFQLHLANEIIHRFDIAQEDRTLGPLEFELRKLLKTRVLGLAAIERSRRRQASRVTWLREGDANTRYFHIKMNSRRRKNYVHTLTTDQGILTAHEEKEAAFHRHFSRVLGTAEAPSLSFNWSILDLPSLSTGGLDNPFTSKEIWEAIKDSPAEKAPGPDGFTGIFYRRCWGIIKQDILEVFHHLFHLAGGDFFALNRAFICLLPKKDGASSTNDFRPISLIHSIAKLFAKVLARRLSTVISGLISPAQSAFLRTRTIHDNFLYVRNLARSLNRKKKPSLLIKLDFAKAFDSVSWEYLLDLLQHLGFSPRWRDWIALLLSTTTSAVSLNGATGPPIFHRRGLRQGDPLSPLLFIIAINPLQKIFQIATASGFLSPLPVREANFRMSLYADDAIFFLNPVADELDMAFRILHCFGLATGLHINIAKCSVAPIRCDNVDLTSVLAPFTGERVSFPIRYLGLPLSLGRVRHVHLQHILDRARSHLASWKGRWINAGGRKALVSSVLSTLPIFALTVLKIPPSFLKEFDKIRRNFIWDIEDNAPAGGKCKVSWKKICSPLQHGGLGLPNLSLFGRALRLRWLWLEWSDEARPWLGSPTPCDEGDRALFHAATRVTIGDGKRASFWHSSWLGTAPLDQQFPALYAASRRKNKTVAAAIQNNSWVLDLGRDLPTHLLHDFIRLWRLVQTTTLRQNIPDAITWLLSKDGSYTASSAYKIHFEGQVRSEAPTIVWQQWAPAKCKLFLWLLLQDRLWCADRLQRRRCPNEYFCPLCVRNLETSWHLFFECPFAQQIWQGVASWRNCGPLAPSVWALEKSFSAVWHKILASALPCHRKGTKSIFTLVCWAIWRERNSRIFQGKLAPKSAIIACIRDEAREWAFANAKALRELMFDPP